MIERTKTNPLVAFDESGNTGQDLLNADQSIFTLASVHVKPEVEAELAEGLSPGAAKERRFKNLKSHSSGREKVLALFRSPHVRPASFKVSIYHKRYMVTTKIIDLLVENLAYETGFDLYERGLNIAMSNLHHMAMSAFCGEPESHALQQMFVEMIRRRDPSSRDRFYTQIARMIERCRYHPYRDDLRLLAATSAVVDEVLAHVRVTDLDPAIPSFVVHCGEWGEEFGEPFDVVHDASKPIEHERELLEILMTKDEPRVEVGYDRRKARLPLLATGISFASSEEVRQIQLADVVAGAAAYWASGKAGSRVDNGFCRALEETNLLRLVCLAVWPSSAFTPEALGTVERGGIQTVAYVTDMIVRQRGKRGRATS